MRRPDSNRADNSELVRFWVLADGTRCVLVSVASGLELRIVRDGTIVRQAPCSDVRFMRHSAELWRVEYEMEHAVPQGSRIVCPECGDDAIVYLGSPDSVRWLGCGSCGYVWLYETDASTRHTR